MNVEQLESRIQILSAPPVFDEATADDLMKRVAADVSEVGPSLGEVLSRLLVAGLIEERKGCWRVVDSLREELRGKLWQRSPQLFKDALAIFLARGTNGSQPAFQRALGVRAAEIVLAAARLGIEPDETRSFDAVVRLVEDGAYRGRSSDATAAAVHLLRLPAYSDRERQLAFLEGLTYWRRDRRRSAAERFQQLLGLERRRDLAEAIAMHLLAVSEADDGNNETAVSLLNSALAILRDLGDRRGQAQVLTTLGGTEREIASAALARADNEVIEPDRRASLMSFAEKHFDLSQDALDEAIGLEEELGDVTGQGLAYLQLSLCYLRMGETDLAIETARDAEKLISREDPNYLRVLTLLASMLRANEDYLSAAEILDEAVRYAEDSDIRTLNLAKLVNVLASNERKLGSLGNARRHAEMSVRLGRAIGNPRHLSHALHTLAVILGDLARDERELLEARRALSESETILSGIGDRRGLLMVETTKRVLDDKLRRLGR